MESWYIIGGFVLALLIFHAINVFGGQWCRKCRERRKANEPGYGPYFRDDSK